MLSFVTATNLGISPGNLIFNGSVNEKICKNLTINTDYRGGIIGESKWIDIVKENRNIRDYNLNSIDLNLNIEFPERIDISKNIWNIPVCITAKKPGKYNGAIIYKTVDSYAGVGSWIEVDINKNDSQPSDPDPITGFFSGTPKNNEMKNSLSLISIVVFIMLLIMLSVLLVISKKARR
jgi:hypothetical protein